jgi:hypothetical protein
MRNEPKGMIARLITDVTTTLVKETACRPFAMNSLKEGAM